jgi:hypothetical protein
MLSVPELETFARINFVYLFDELYGSSLAIDGIWLKVALNILSELFYYRLNTSTTFLSSSMISGEVPSSFSLLVL